MELFDEFIVVDEKAISELTVQNCDNCNSKFRDVTQFAALEFVTSSGPRLKIKDIGNASSSNPSDLEPLAQIVSWYWHQNGAQQIIEFNTLNKGREIKLFFGANDSPSFVIRILKNSDRYGDNVFSGNGA